MADSQFGASSFEFYEGIRILIPGAVVAALYASITATFFGEVPDFPGGQTLGVVTLGVFAGIVTYFIDAPSKAAAFRDNIPDRVLRDWGIQPPPDVRSTVNTYFILLDELIPQPIRARALYMGSIYRIGFELIYLLGGGSIAVIATAGARAVIKKTPGEPFPVWALFAFLLAGVLTLLWAVHSSALRSGRTLSGWQRHWRAFRSIFGQTRGWMGLWLSALVTVGGVLSTYFAYRVWQLVLAWILGAYWVWAVRYFRGYRSGDSERTEYRRLDPPAAVLLFLIPAVLAGLYLWKSQREGVPGPSTGAIACWFVGVALTAVLICARGHEKRLFGSYASQRTWLHYNKTTVVRIYGDDRLGPRTSDEVT